MNREAERDSVLVFGQGGYKEYPAGGGQAPEADEAEAGKEAKTLRLSGRPALYAVPEGAMVDIGPDPSCAIVVPPGNEICLFGNKAILKKGVCHHNGKLVGGGDFDVRAGDCILVGALLVTIKSEGVECVGSGYAANLKELVPAAGRDGMEGFPEYKRPPRIVKQPKQAEIEIAPPKAPEKAGKGQALKTLLPPLVMAGVMVAARMGNGGSLMMMLMGAGMAVAAIFSATSYFTDKKGRAADEAKRRETYGAYLLAKRKELDAARAGEEEARAYTFPTLGEIERLALGYSSRIYERTPHDADFLSVSLGYADQPPAYSVRLQEAGMDSEKDGLREEADAVAENFRTLKSMPLAADLKKAHLGLVGEKGLIHEELCALIAQLCFFQSYHDMEIAIVSSGGDAKDFEWARWHPHLKLSQINVSGLISTENQRDLVLGSLTQILKGRRMKRNEGKKETQFLPHFVFVVDAPKMIVGHSIMEYLQEAGTSLGFSLIWASAMRQSLPENIGTILSIDGALRGNLVMDERKLLLTPVRTHDIAGIDFAKMARRLAPLKHSQGVSTQIPESIAFFDLMGIKRPEDLPILDLWRQGNSAKSLAVPLGLRGPGDVVSLNLHEKAHGPHGLVAGTTGSGKSEIIQSYILSLACSFHPYEVGFLLIDYKGGGMANLFSGLPHLLGTITNLDGSESMRALASIKSELARRQRIFTGASVNSITSYTKAFKRGEAAIPLPHLFIISDEFAELKKEQPEFMSELVSAARIGRSLGVHLILATQKPSGVVDDQIWSNSKFKLALKVQDAADSNEVLKTPDAAMITIPGRAYLQVGNNEIYELFQSAWSGAGYSEKEVEKGFDSRVYLINGLGQGVLLNEDLSAAGEAQESKLTQLDAMVRHIAGLYEGLHIEAVEKPWLPPLPERLVSPYVAAPAAGAAKPAADLTVAIGLVDIPEQQAQTEFVHDFPSDGNFAVFGASGFGKSTVLMNMALALAAKNTPEDVHFYILDFGNSALVQLKDLPHTADYMVYDEEEKIGKFMRILTEEAAKRKKLFARERAGNFKMYNRVAGEKLPAIAIFVDGFDVVKELPGELAEFFMRMTRDGTGVGIFTAISVTSHATVRYAVMANFKNKISLFQFEQSEQSAIVGRSKYTLPEIRGRAAIKLKDVSLLQCYLPVPGDDEIGYSKNVGAIAAKLKDAYPDSRVEGIPMLPETVTLADIARAAGMPPHLIPVGLDAGSVQKVCLDIREGRHIIVGSPRSGKTTLLKAILLQTAHCTRFVADAEKPALSEFSGQDGVAYMGGLDDAGGFMKKLKQASEEKAEDGALLLLAVDDGDRFAKALMPNAAENAPILKAFLAAGGAIFVTAPMKGMEYGEIAGILKETAKGIVIGAPNETNPFNFVRSALKAEPSGAWVFGYGEPHRIKLPLPG
ncbi:MAG: type VII secretion protein EssC [Clostridiales Family XIII bacterium]|jgi:S-DNA-T family DNA segregation ATPase FtsK/SpoIIIE|nr:type VII secretion protein EssC [Clostridiales Family XIII bacterium]